MNIRGFSFKNIVEFLKLKQNKTNFVELLRKNNPSPSDLYVKIIGDRTFQVMQTLDSPNMALYGFTKDVDDDFILFTYAGIYSYAYTSVLNTYVNYTATTGTWNTSSVPNYYTTQVGATFSGSFTGSGFQFRHLVDNRGGIWQFVVDGDSAHPITISTYADTSTTVNEQIITGLSYGNHTYVATFMGADPNHAPSGGTARGWCCFNNGTASGAETIRPLFLNPSVKFQLLDPASNKEFAFSVRPHGTAYDYQWLPEHANIGTTFAESQHVYLDGVELTDWTADTYLHRTVNTVKIVQNMVCKHSSDASNPVANLTLTTTITRNGVETTGKITFLRDTDITAGYVCMLPMSSGFSEEVITSFKNRYPTTATDGSTNDLTAENDKCISFITTNKTGSSGQKDYAAAMTVTNVPTTWRFGKSGRKNPLVWIQHRDSVVQKLYPQVFNNYTALAGEVFTFSGKYIIGHLVNANSVV